MMALVAFCDKRLDVIGIDEIVLQTRFAKHRLKVGPAHCQDAGDIGVGGHDDFGIITPAEHPLVGEQNHRQRLKAVAGRNAVFRSAVLGKVLAETC